MLVPHEGQGLNLEDELHMARRSSKSIDMCVGLFSTSELERNIL